MTTLYTAKKYAVPALEKNCVDYLKRHLCADNAFLLLTQARLFDEPQVRNFLLVDLLHDLDVTKHSGFIYIQHVLK